MGIRVALNHKTEYSYDRLVTLGPHVIRLRPAPHCRTPILSYSLRVQPEPHFLNWQQDPYSNYLARLVFLKPAHAVRVEVDLVADLTIINPFDFFIEKSAEHYPFTYSADLARELAPYLEFAEGGPRLLALVESARRRDLISVDFLVEINQRVHKEVSYVIRMEPGVQTCEVTLESGCGSCRDSAWLLVQTLRRLGLAARFVSGYLIQLAADQKSLDGPSGPERDFTDLHAWAEVYLPGAGWVGLDPTSGLLAGEGHIPLACAADPVSAAAITGSYSWEKDPQKAEEEKCGEEFHFEMQVTRVLETPRVTKPYTEEQWQAIDAMGERVDRDLREWDVRLTMGGEPTFISLDDFNSPEWTTAALGPAKRRAGGILLKRLRDRFAPGALLHFGQGKWYPGESLPRWAFGCYWRRDGIALWEDPALVGEIDRNYGHGPEDARTFADVLTGRLGVNPAHSLPGYEDAWYYLWRERQLPANVDPMNNRLDDPEERRRLAKVFDQGLKKIIGYALPLRRRGHGDAKVWESGAWFLRREHLFLIPGDSPMGYRLPLDSLPWEPLDRREVPMDIDPSAPRGPLPQRRDELHQHRNGKAPVMFGPRAWGAHAADGVVRTSLVIEPREGRLHIFMPPQESLEDYLDLVNQIEATAAQLQMPVLLEGYKPPSDHRLNNLAITPDPGVIEVNIHPANTWKELEANTTAVYEEARQARLGADKFQLDGRHTGTGGGNHIVLGGPSPADSPLLRRPDLLRSLLAFWHNHPSLSYLFSSLFMGPTSQAPRVDEARNDNLYELELAFSQVPLATNQPWLSDRLFRHLLTDVTGNTHRAEFCIDKLYSPDSFEGRRGLLELRAFEMPPHSRMSLVQQLLLRVLVANFWKSPYQARLARWGTELHDRFLLPHFIEQDLDDLLHELKTAGYPVAKEWFAPHLEFRYPLLGTVANRGVWLEIRQAAEPWHVLGEQTASGAAARYVDSSLERLQVLVRGMTDGRHFVACNGRRLPLHPTGVNGEFVAGVRYRAWQPPECLHPTIPVHAPLVFDVYDMWTGRAIGGCQYHVAHPGGRSYETFPVNAAEAESRRVSRFFSFGHSPGPWVLPPEERNAECPLTLDLRQGKPARSSAAPVFQAEPQSPSSRMRAEVIMK